MSAPATPSPGFDRLARSYDADRGGLERGRRAAEELLPHLVPGPVLEVGVGTGAVALALREHGFEVFGVDIAEQMLDLARERLGHDAVTHGDAQELPYGQGEFDNIVLAHVLHLVDDLDRAVAEVARVLRPGGRAVVVHGHPRGDRDDLEEATAPLAPYQERRADSPEGLRKAALAAGLLVLEQGPGAPYEQGLTPAGLARSIEERRIAYLWKLSDEEWTRAARPALAALRALPDQDRSRVNAFRFQLTVLGKD